MKKVALFILLATTIVLSACGKGGDKFLGQWKVTVDTHGKGGIASITKKDDNYMMTLVGARPFSFPLYYDKSKDALVGGAMGSMIVITYLKDKGHIVISNPRGGMFNEPVELQKAE